MDTNVTGMCHVCGEPGGIHVTELHNGKMADRSFCPEHAPVEVRDQIPFGPHLLSHAEQLKLLHKRLFSLIGEQTEGMTWHPVQRVECEAKIKQVIADIAALEQRVSDTITDVASLRRRVGEAD